MDPATSANEDATVIAPSLGRRFSGINATMEALLPVMRRHIAIACCGSHLSEQMPTTTLHAWLQSPSRRRWRIWHARRNNDMIAGLFLRYVLRQKLILLWTSAAQRQHSRLTRWLYHRMDGVIATTDIAASFLTCDSVTIHHGVDTRVFHPPADRRQVRAALGLKDRPTIGIFGRVRPQKGTGDLVEALVRTLGEHPDWHVLFVGATTQEYRPYQHQLETQLKAAGIADRVRFHGYLKDFSELPKWYQAVDVVGCVSRNEGFGVTCLEGMASGVPVLATKAGAWPEIVDEGKTGWIAEANDPGDLARALRLVFEASENELQEMGRQARQAVENRFSIERESNRVISVYRDLFERYGEAFG